MAIILEHLLRQSLTNTQIQVEMSYKCFLFEFFTQNVGNQLYQMFHSMETVTQNAQFTRNPPEFVTLQ